MHIGLDFDNTIVNYDRLFYLLALEKKLIPTDIPNDRLSVRDYLRHINEEDKWTALQGEVYGLRMQEADPFPDMINFIQKAKNSGHQISIVSHKTKYPYAGPPYDLHKSARNWIKKYLVINNEALLPEQDIYFELTKEAKLRRIDSIACDIFIDDLPEILLAPNFPSRTQGFLFDPKAHYRTHVFSHIKTIQSWQELDKL